MAELTLQDLLDSGLSLENLIMGKGEAPIVQVTLDSRELAKALRELKNSHSLEMSSVLDRIDINNKSNKDILVKAISLLVQKAKQTPPIKPVKGLRVLRNSLNLITELRYIT